MSYAARYTVHAKSHVLAKAGYLHRQEALMAAAVLDMASTEGRHFVWSRRQAEAEYPDEEMVARAKARLERL